MAHTTDQQRDTDQSPRASSAPPRHPNASTAVDRMHPNASKRIRNRTFALPILPPADRAARNEPIPTHPRRAPMPQNAPGCPRNAASALPILPPPQRADFGTNPIPDPHSSPRSHQFSQKTKLATGVLSDNL